MSSRWHKTDCLRRAAALFLLAGCLPSLACKKNEAGFVIETSDGVRIVRNLAPKPGKAYRSPGLAEDISIGGEDAAGDALLYAPVDIDADVEGDIYILDRRDAVVRIFDEHGSFVRTIGRKGQGPGEFESPVCMDLAPDGKIMVVDQSQMRLTTMAPNGDFVESILLQEYISDIGRGTDGALVAGYDDPENSKNGVGRLDAGTGRVTPLFSQTTYWPARKMDNDMTYDFPYFVRFALDANGRLYAGSAVAYEINVLDLGGRLEFKIRKDAERIQVQGEMRNRIAGMTLLQGPNPYARNPYYPFFDSLGVDEQGRLWIRHYLPKFSARTYPETPYDVFSPEGVFLFETRLPGHIASKLVFRNGCVYALRKVEAGYLEAIRLRAKG